MEFKSNKIILKKESQMTEKSLNKYSKFLVIMEVQIKIALRFHHTPIKMSKINKMHNCSHW